MPLSLAILVLACAPQGEAPAPLDAAALAERIATVVDLPTASARAAAARALAERDGVTVEALLAACRSFGAFETAAPGTRREVVSLAVGDAREETEIHAYVPKGYDPTKAAPLLLLLHGAGGDGDGLHRLFGDVPDRLGAVVIAPTEAGPNEGYAFSRRERLAGMAVLRHARRHFHVDESRVLVAGVSRGGHMAWDLILRYPDVFAAAAPMIGGPRLLIGNGQNNLRYLDAVLPLPIRDLQGAKDDPRLVADLRLAFRRLKERKAADAQLLEFDDLGHSFRMAAVDWAEFLGGARRDPRPERVVCLSAGGPSAASEDGRAFWAQILATGKDVEEDFVPKVRKSEWDRLDDDGKRRWMNDEAEKRTARLEVTRKGVGRFTAKARGVERFRLLLEAGDFDPAKPVEVAVGPRTIRTRVAANARVLLEEFAERFDRTFLPVAEVVIDL